MLILFTSLHVPLTFLGSFSALGGGPWKLHRWRSLACWLLVRFSQWVPSTDWRRGREIGIFLPAFSLLWDTFPAVAVYLNNCRFLPGSPFSPVLSHGAKITFSSPFLFQSITRFLLLTALGSSTSLLILLILSIPRIVPLSTSSSFSPLVLPPGACWDLEFTLQYLVPGSLGPSLAAGLWDVFHQCKWSHFHTCIVELIPTWSLICSPFPKFQRVIRHRDVIEPILDPCHLGTIAVSKQEWCFQNTVLITVSRPTLLLPAVDTNTDEVLPGGS